MRGATILPWLILLASVGVSIHWWHEAFAPMTSEKYARLCGDRPECYPEYAYLLGAVLMGLVAVVFALMLVLLRLRRLRVHQ
jgi:hypothetical protein